MVVFDRTLYFATFKPDALNNVCGGGAVAKLWGMDYLAPQLGAPPSNSGGAFRWCPSGSVNSAGQCLTAFTDSETSTVPNSIISGVTLRPSLACTQFGSIGDDPTGGITGVTPQTYELFFSLSAPRGANGLPTPQAERKSMAIQVPKVSAMVDAWSLVFD